MKHKLNSYKSLSRRKVLKYGLYGGLSAAVPSNLWLKGCGKWRSRKKPNVILISIDTVRNDHCSVSGYQHDTTPNLRLLAKQGTTFTVAYSPSAQTCPSHATMLTALYPMEHRVLKNGLKLSQEHKSIANLLTERNYQTAAVISSFVLNSKFGYAQGFSFFDDDIEVEASSAHEETHEGHKVKGGFDQRANYTTPKAIRWLQEHRDPARPFFMLLHYWDPHAPYDPPESFASQFTPKNPSHHLYTTIGMYDGEIAFADYEIGKLLTALKQMKLEANTLLVITSDHGEGLMQHWHMGHTIHLYEEAVRIPLIFHWPNHIPKGLTINAPVGLISLAPTILDLIGIDPGNGPFRRQSLADAIRGQTKLDPTRPVFIYRSYFEGEQVNLYWVEGEKFAIRIGKWKYIEGKDEKTKELFDISKDPREQTNLYSDIPKRSAELASILNEWQKEYTKIDSAPAKIAEEDLEALKTLGYTQ